MRHFICEGGCKGVSEVEGTCQDPNCPDFGKPLLECDCEDGVHHKTSDDESEAEGEE
jgi:hypothetical protein